MNHIAQMHPASSKLFSAERVLGSLYGRVLFGVDALVRLSVEGNQKEPPRVAGKALGSFQPDFLACSLSPSKVVL